MLNKVWSHCTHRAPSFMLPFLFPLFWVPKPLVAGGAIQAKAQQATVGKRPTKRHIKAQSTPVRAVQLFFEPQVLCNWPWLSISTNSHNSPSTHHGCMYRQTVPYFSVPTNNSRKTAIHLAMQPLAPFRSLRDVVATDIIIKPLIVVSIEKSADEDCFAAL